MGSPAPRPRPPPLDPWANEEWRYADYELLFALDLPIGKLAGLPAVVGSVLTEAGFYSEQRGQWSPVPPGSAGTENSFAMLYERLSEPDRKTALRDLVMPDGSLIVLVSAVLFAAIIVGWLATGGQVIGHPLTWIVIIGLPLCVVGLWWAARSRRFVRTIGVNIRLVPHMEPGPGVPGGAFRVEVLGSRLNSQLTYPKPLYATRRAFVDSTATREVGPAAARLRSAIEAMPSQAQPSS
jgi:hypothetical protein